MTDRGVTRHRSQAKKSVDFLKKKVFKGGGWSIWRREKMPNVKNSYHEKYVKSRSRQIMALGQMQRH